MEVIILKNPSDVAQRGADLCVELIKKKPTAVLGLATGSTPLSLYEELVKRCERKEVSFKNVRTFNLDEYVGLEGSHPQSYRYYMDHNFFDKIDIEKANTFVPQGDAKNPVAVGFEYENQITKAGGIDLQILGIGRNGHIGFNEPSSSLSSRTRIKTLTETTIGDNKRFFRQGEFQPGLGITMGIGTIMEAKQILLLATGEQKTEAIKAAVEGPITAMCPASVLQMHRKVTAIIDEAAAEDLHSKPYYYWVLSQQQKIEKLYGR